MAYDDADMTEEASEPAVMSDEDLEALVEAEVSDAVAFIDSDIGAQRAEAVKLYRGEPLGNEEEGRSQFVSRDVADTISAILPSLMRVFFGPEHVVEFVPTCEEDEPVAQQQTDYINYVVTRDNPGFEIFYAVLKNALREKVGVIKWWWDDSIEVTTKLYTGLDDDSVTKLLEDLQAETTLDAEILSAEDRSDGTKDVKLKLKRRVDRARIAAVPPEEFLISRDATSIDNARLVGHRCEKTVSELVAMGYERDLVEAHAGDGDDLNYSQERLARSPSNAVGRSGPSNDPSTRLVTYVESYITADQDGDGIAELLKVCTIGGKLAHWEAVDERPFADFHMDPEPHAFFGESVADKTRDIQFLKSALIRSGLDSLASSIFPRTVVGPGVEMDDVLNNEVGAVVRSPRGVGEVRTEVTPDVSPAALNWLGYADAVREGRTGMSNVSMGLDAESLQNTTATAAEGHFTRSQERIELIARIMASGFRRLFRGLSHLVAANQRQERVVKLRNQWTPIDPRAWRADMDVQPNVGLGGGSDQHKAQVLSMVMQTQSGIFAQYGLSNPFVTVGQYLETAGTFLECAGFKSPDKFFNAPEQADQMVAQQEQAKAQAGPPPDPKMAEVQAKAQLSAQEAEAKHGLAMQQAYSDAEVARYRAELDAQVAAERHAREMDLKEAQADAELRLKERVLVSEMALKERQLAAEAQLKAQQVAHGQYMDEQAASTDIGEVEPGGEPG